MKYWYHLRYENQTQFRKRERFTNSVFSIHGARLRDRVTFAIFVSLRIQI